MYEQEKIKPYDGEGEKGKLIEEMFDNIAPTYDTLNHRLSGNIDKGWRVRYSQISSHSARNLFAKEHHWLGKYLYFRHCFVCLWKHQLQEKGENAYHFDHTKAAS